ncbi:hypothetical protein [Cryptosporangium aurantiacum]|uniref:Uncharacterized protein n=1 Tax=Cryptosporangium aurantiacum TaxID=134849 RepID=A0A1M7RIX9_9ACTN|nr:hypothetical protein [Cryptosporangium aurantiacum]SHN46099.1 hypothetical protein SAMN05443668_113183 [Cryptosporangium aurantiacum]
MSQSMPFPRPRGRSEDAFASERGETPGELPKRIPGAALHGVPGARHAAPVEQPRLDWRPYPPRRPRSLVSRVVAALRARLRL